MRPPTDPPVFLLADSAPLFTFPRLFDDLRSSRRPEVPERIRAVYIGASNGDVPQFFDVFRAAMQRGGAACCAQIFSRFTADDRRHLAAADWVVLAGGDVARGWRVLAGTGMGEALLRRRRQGAVVLGVSAGAVQLGLGAPAEDGGWIETFGVVRRVIDVHDEDGAWRRLDRAVAQRARESGEARPGLGIPSRGAAKVEPGGAGTVRIVPLAGTALYRSPAGGASATPEARSPRAVARGTANPRGEDRRGNDD